MDDLDHTEMIDGHHPFDSQAQLILPYLLPDVRLPRAPCFMPRSVPWKRCSPVFVVFFGVKV